jgi:SAM-dependent methyltransferase
LARPIEVLALGAPTDAIRSRALTSSYDAIPDFGLLYDSVPLYQARSEDVRFYVEEATEARGAVLEVGCGTGRVLLPAARAGCEITGIDSSAAMLARCAENLQRESASVRDRVTLVEADARDFYLEREFALVTAPFRIVQHLVTVDDQLRFLAAVRRHLAPGGRLVFDVFNPSFRALVGADGEEREDTPPTALADGRTFRRAVRVARVRWVEQVSEIEIAYYVSPSPHEAERRFLQAFDMRWYLRAELEHLLARGGFRLLDAFGDFSRAPLADTSPEIVIRAERM